MKPIKCIGCGNKIEDEHYWKCEDCRTKELKKRQCQWHEPRTLSYSTTCKNCGENIVPKEWRIQ